MFQAFLIQTLVTGGVYALLAVGFSLIFGVARMINLAHTAFFMLAAYGMFFVTYQLGLDPISAILISLVVTTLIALASYKLFIDRIREHEVTVLLITIALAIVLTILGTILTHILSAIIEVIRTGEEEPEIDDVEDERDKMIDLRGIRVTYIAFSLGVFISMLAFVFGQPGLVMFALVIFFGLIAQVTGDISRLCYYRRGF